MDDSYFCVHLFSSENKIDNLLTNITNWTTICLDPSIVSLYEIQNQSVTDDKFTSRISSPADLDALWLVFAGILVFLMQMGFTMLESGVVKAPNVQHILFKNVCNLYIQSHTHRVT